MLVTVHTLPHDGGEFLLIEQHDCKNAFNDQPAFRMQMQDDTFVCIPWQRIERVIVRGVVETNVKG